KKENYLLQQQDAYIKVAGGVKLTEPAVDLSVIVATASSFKDKVMGFGHRVYKDGDPRAKYLREMSRQITKDAGREELFEMS
ncbi:citrate/2-methylcitrate synthase, partial [Staphylococcus aureus]|uniref:citrate/2-methylcitrate synthase n=1 Tax=Staphylococcus aureus TaxID=1280 RepID=UPI0025B720A2